MYNFGQKKFILLKQILLKGLSHNLQNLSPVTPSLKIITIKITKYTVQDNFEIFSH